MKILTRKSNERLDTLTELVSLTNKRIDLAAESFQNLERDLADINRRLNALSVPEMDEYIKQREAQNLVLELGKANDAIKAGARIAKGMLS